MTGYLKVAKEGEGCVVYVFTDENESFNGSLQIVTRSYDRCGTIEDFSEWAEKHDLEIVPRDPETYTDWKVGDKVISNTGNQVNTLIAVLGKAIVLVSDAEVPITGLTTADNLTKYDKLILTDYEKELIHVRELEKKKECPFKEGDKVLVRDSDTSWTFDIFQNYEENACYSYECLDSEYEQCIPLNEHTWKLLGTTDEYKEEE